jgi:hypothetical protein
MDGDALVPGRAGLLLLALVLPLHRFAAGEAHEPVGIMEDPTLYADCTGIP